MATLVQIEGRSVGERVGDGFASDVDSIVEALERTIDGDVRFDAGSRAQYSTDASNYRQVPIGVVMPRHERDVIDTLRVCRQHRVPVLGRGGGTSLAGQCCNTAVVLDFTRYMNRVLEIDAERRTARVQPGAVLDALRERAREHGLTFGPDPATHDHCTLGGMIGNNSCGVHSVLSDLIGPGPRTEHQVVELDVVTYDGTRMRVNVNGMDADEAGNGRQGEIERRLKALVADYGDAIRSGTPDIPRRVSGYNLPALLPENGFNVAASLVGSESTCVLILQAEVRLIRQPAHTILVVLGFPDIHHAADAVPAVLSHRPSAVEAIDDRLVEDMRLKGMRLEDLDLLPDGGGWLLVELADDDEGALRSRAEVLSAAMRERAPAPRVELLDSVDEVAKVWEVRESGLGATAFVPARPAAWPGWEDAAVPPDRLGSYLRQFRELLNRYEYEGALYGHFGQGCVHTRIDFELTDRPGIEKYLRFIHEAADLVASHGGSLSGEHGDGQARGDLLRHMYGEDVMRAFREFKRIWDPDGGMNPGKLIDAAPPDANLRLGADYQPARSSTHFAYPDDGHSFAQAALRCVGVGKCRRESGGVMCPSYMVTREEEHSTRGRARLLFEMLNGEELEDGWASEAVHDALDLCLACKGCKGDCPVHVDMATYKAEFLSHYYETRRRPRSAYSMGWIRRWAELASHVPRLANAVAHAPIAAGAIKLAAGVSRHRTMPRFARRTFRGRFEERTRRPRPGPTVILWPDTFNDHFHPETAVAAVRVLEGAGYEVRLPRAGLCCGRPLYDYGMLDRAKARLREVIDSMRTDIRRGTPVVGLEPSCVATFRDEMVNLFPHDEDARRLARQTLTLTEFLDREQADFGPARLSGCAIVHGHCHHVSVLDFDAEKRVLDRLGMEVDVLDCGCCGMAGSFGFESDHFDVSQACAERVLLPALRDTPAASFVVADGFSCREMVAQNGLPRPMHVAELIDHAMRTSRELRSRVSRSVSPHGNARGSPRSRTRSSVGRLAAAIAGTAMAGIVVARMMRGR